MVFWNTLLYTKSCLNESLNEYIIYYINYIEKPVLLGAKDRCLNAKEPSILTPN